MLAPAMAVPWTISPWVGSMPDLAQPLQGTLDVDVAIVGAGVTGLSSALELSKAGLSVAVVESAHAGHGATGRSAGHLLPTIGKDLPTLVRSAGLDAARDLLSLAEQAVLHTEGLIAEHRIECDYVSDGNVLAAVHPSQFEAVDAAARVAEQVGLPGELCDGDRLGAIGLPRAFSRGLWVRAGGVLDPARYVLGLRSAVIDAKIPLFERSPVTRIEAGRHAVLHTPLGQLRAPRIVIATDAHRAVRDAPVPQVAPVSVQLFCTEPLSDEDVASVRWSGRQGILTTHELSESYGLTADRRLVGGAKFVRCAYRVSEPPIVDTGLAARMEAVFRVRFPELGALEVTDHWSGTIGFSVDFLPLVGASGAHRNFFHAIGFGGHGLALGSYAGRMITDLVLERPGPGRALWERRTWPMPPAPLRWMVAKALTGWWGRRDGAVDRQVAAR
jgi:glycine/D-amino acid oxidase-like deaminating enzyme